MEGLEKDVIIENYGLTMQRTKIGKTAGPLLLRYATNIDKSTINNRDLNNHSHSA